VLYSIYGLFLDADLAIPGLSPYNDQHAADVRIQFRPGPGDEPRDAAAERVWYRSQSYDGNGSDDAVLTIFQSTADGRFRFRYPDGVEFLIDRSGCDVRANWPPTSSLDDVALYLTGPLLGFLLRLRGVVALHASVVSVDDRAVAFVGPAGAGKSTTAAAFAARGYPILTEDVAALFEDGDAFSILPGYPHIGLWPDSAEMLFGSPEALPPFTAGWDKRCLALTRTGSFVGRSLPVRAIYLLGDRSASNPPSVTHSPAGAAMIALLGNIYGNLLFHRELRVQEIDTIRSLVAAVPVRTVIPGSDSAALPALCDVVLDDLSSHDSRRPAASTGM
jgi:hypothetical protein